MNSNDSGRASTRVGPGVALAALQARPAEDVSRREVARGLLGALSLAALSGCASSAASEERAAPSLLGNTAQALSGTDVAWVDTVLGAGAAYARTGDLATRFGGGADLGTLVVAKGCVAPGDRGGGLFYWDAAGGTDDGGTVIVPSASGGAVGNSGPCWRRIFDDALSVCWFGTTSLRYDTCDESAIHKCVAVAASLGGRTVFFPAGEYYLYSPIYVLSNGIRLIGEGEYSTHLRKAGNDATVICFKSNGPPLTATSAAVLCEVSNLHITPQYAQGTSVPETEQTQGGAITFDDQAGGVSARIENVFIEDAFRGIVFGAVRSGNNPASFSGWSVHEASVANVKMIRIRSVGLYMRFALNCNVRNVVIDVATTAGSFGVWLDTCTEGCIFDSVFVLGGEHSWRFAHSHISFLFANDRAPSENRFYSCIGDNGRVSCFYMSAGFRMIFDNCWASTQHNDAIAAFSIDNPAVYGIVWTNSQMVFLKRNGFQITNGKLITISNSTFTSWGLAGAGFRAISITSNLAPLSFSIVGNVFGTGGTQQLADPNFTPLGSPTTSPPASPNTSVAVSIAAGTYYKYLVSNNLGLTLGSTLLDSGGTPTGGKLVNNNI